MTTIIKAADVRTISLGIAVARATATLPQTTTGAIFTVAGGRVALRMILGEVTTALGATATSLNIVFTPTGGSAADLCAATVCTSDAVGTLYHVSGVGADLLSAQTVAGTEVPNVTYGQLMKYPLVLDTGSIGLKASGSDTGSVKWDLIYVPLDVGATVAAA